MLENSLKSESKNYFTITSEMSYSFVFFNFIWHKTIIILSIIAVVLLFYSTLLCTLRFNKSFKSITILNIYKYLHQI